MVHKEIVLKSFPPNPCTHLPTQPCDPFPLDELHHMFFNCEWFLMFWAAASNTLMRWRRRSWQSQGEYLISMLVSLFYRMVGWWVYILWSFPSSFLELQWTSTHQHTNGQKPSSDPNLQTSEQPAHTSSVGWGSQLNWEWGLDSNTIYCTDNIVRNLLYSTGNTWSLVEQDAVPQVGTGTLPSIHITTVTGGIISATSRWPPTPPREVWLSYTQKKPKLVKLHRKD